MNRINYQVGQEDDSVELSDSPIDQYNAAVLETLQEIRDLLKQIEINTRKP